MRAATRHPHVSAVACKVYGLTIRLYPTEFRHAFGQELVVTFRNRLEDVLDGGGILDWLAFAGHIGVDWMRTCSTLMTESRPRDSGSLLGLSEGDAAFGCVDRATADGSGVFVVVGIALSCIGWYGFMTLLASSVPVNW